MVVFCPGGLLSGWSYVRDSALLAVYMGYGNNGPGIPVQSVR